MANLPISYHPEARREADEAFEFYRARSPQAAESFLQSLEAAHVSIQSSPDRWAKYLYGTRRFLIDRFPYIVIYRVAEGRIAVLAVAHGHRKPGYWADRVK